MKECTKLNEDCQKGGTAGHCGGKYGVHSGLALAVG